MRFKAEVQFNPQARLQQTEVYRGMFGELVTGKIFHLLEQ